jgi:hypothetical protein
MTIIRSLNNHLLAREDEGTTLNETLELIRRSMPSRNLVEADFQSTTLSGVDFGGINLSGASFSGSTLTEVSFRECVLLNTDFTSSRVTNTSFERAKLTDACFLDADLIECNFLGASSDLIRTNYLQIVWDNSIMVEEETKTIEEWDQILRDDPTYLDQSSLILYQTYRTYLIGMRGKPPSENRTFRSRFDREVL